MKFVSGSAKITLSQNDIAKAVEFWLNEKVLRFPCEISKLFETRVNHYSTFEITLQEKTQDNDD